jgi:hypothetical protein
MASDMTRQIITDCQGTKHVDNYDSYGNFKTDRRFGSIMMLITKGHYGYRVFEKLENSALFRL